jgi:hypothetical protein
MIVSLKAILLCFGTFIVQGVPYVHDHHSIAAMMEHRIKIADAEQNADTIYWNEKSLWFPCRIFRLNLVPKLARIVLYDIISHMSQ